MIELGSILAITGLVIRVIAAVGKAIEVFDRVQNAPKELRQFHKSLIRLRANFKLLEAELRTTGLTFPGTDLEDLEETLTLSQVLFETYRNKHGPMTSALRGTWLKAETTKLEKYQARIDRNYTEIIFPLWLAAIANRGRAVDDIQSQIDSSAIQTNPRQTVIDEENLGDLSQTIDNLKNSADQVETERNLRHLDQVLCRCWTRLNLPIESIEEFIDLPAPIHRRGSSVLFKSLPTTLILETAPPEHKRLRLERVAIMAKDEETRIIRYHGGGTGDAAVQVTHIIPFGCIPWTPDKESTRLSFLDQHVVTVIDKDGHHTYKIDPKYEFPSGQTAHVTEFQTTVREREFRGAHDIVEISSAGEVLARRQVIKFWKRQTVAEGEIVTLTFFANSVKMPSHRERDLRNYHSEPVFVQPLLGHKSETKELKLISISFQHSVRIKFATVRDARDFRNMFKAIYPQNGLTPAATPPDTDWNPGGPPGATNMELDRL